MSKRRADSLKTMLENEFDIVIKSGDIYIEAVVEEVDETARKYSDEVNRTIPKDTGGLKASHGFKRKRTDKDITYSFAFEGSTSKGVPYEKLANIHEYGTKDGRISAKRFQRKALRKIVKGLDKRALQRYRNKGGQV